MKLFVKLYNSADCLLDSRPIHLADGEDEAFAISTEVKDFVANVVLASGDCIRIEEA
jgi:hypothetical protein